MFFYALGEEKCTSNYFVHDKEIERSEESKYLGDMISNDLDSLYENRAEKASGYVSLCLDTVCLMKYL